jgi:eukaryotic-like serine/threonine-protein kinase
MPHRFGPYSLLRCIGSGGMGEVWAAVHVELQMPCAIKLMKPGLRCSLDHASYEGMFLNEANICAQLRHGRIVRVHNAGYIDEQLFIAMDLVDGVNLRELGRALAAQNVGPLPLPLVVHIVAEVLEALDYAHHRTIGGGEGGVIHGDVSPGNIMISSHGEVLLTDFGLGSFVSASSQSKLLVGTPAYMAPERAQGRVCRESDLYSVGAVLHELLTGHTHVPKHASFSELVTGCEQPILPLTYGDVPEPIETLMRGLLERNVERRIGSTRHALAVVERWADHRYRAGELRGLYQEHVGGPHSGLTLVAGMLPEACGTWPSWVRAAANDDPLEDTRPIEAASAAVGACMGARAC